MLKDVVNQHLNAISDKRHGLAIRRALEAMFDPAGSAQWIHIPIPLTATDATRTVFIANSPVKVKALSKIFTVASTSGTLTISKDTGTGAPGSGTALLTAAVALSGTANTVGNGTLISTAGADATLTLAAGDRIAIVIAGTMTGLAGGVATISLCPAG